MRIIHSILLLLFTACTLTIYAQTDKDKLRSLRKEYEQFWKNGDAEGVMKTLWEDAVLMPHHGDPMVVGKEEILTFWFPKDAAPTKVNIFDSKITEVKVSGNQGYLMGTFRLTFEYEQKRYANQGNFINIAEQRNGEWRLSRLIWNDPQATVTPMENKDLPYFQIPDYPDEYNVCTVVARMVDGLGFRYYWATEGLREEDLAYKTSPDARTANETLDHIYGLTTVVLNSVKQQPNIRGGERKELSYEEKRKQTLLMLKEASDILRAADPSEMENFKLIFKRGENQSEYPFWHQLNGPLADALWHTGQIVALRRASGNPFDGRVSVFQGKLRER